MPNTKFNKQTLDAIEARKAEKIAELKDWTNKKIESTANDIKKAANKELDDQFAQMDASLKFKIDNAMAKAESAYKDHVEAASIEYYYDDKNQEMQSNDIIIALSVKCQNLIEDEIKKYQEKEKDINQKMHKLSEERKTIQKELENAQKAVSDKYVDVEKVHISMNDQFEGYHSLSEKDKATRDTKLQSLHEDLQEYNQQLAELVASRDGLEEKLKKCNEEYSNHAKALEEAFIEYKNNEANINRDIAAKKAVAKEDLVNGKKKRKLDLEVKKTVDYKVQHVKRVYNGMIAQAETENSKSKEYIKEQKDKETEEKIEQATEKIKNDADEIKDRVKGSVDIEFELRRIVSLPKKMGHTNTEEFEKMTAAVKESYLALGEINTSKETEKNILSKCVAAYKECQNYIAKKDRKSGFLEWFRSDFGKKRLIFASDMMVKLKEVCPGLEDALKEENVHEDEKKVPNDKGPKRDVKGELDALKKEYQKNNKSQNVKNVEKEPKKENVNRL